jgi:hypothetical protein
MPVVTLEVRNGDKTRVGTLTIDFQPGASIFVWEWVGASWGATKGTGLWLFQSNTKSWHADLVEGPDPTASDLFGELSGHWNVPQHGNAPAAPFARRTSGFLVLFERPGNKSLLTWNN